MSDIQEATAKRYIDEFVKKYDVGTEIAPVPTQVPGSGHANAGLGGNFLRGRKILEVPVQKKSIPQAILDYAGSKGIDIVDVTGIKYN